MEIELGKRMMSIKERNIFEVSLKRKICNMVITI